MEKHLEAYSPAEQFLNRYVHPRAGRTLIVGSMICSDKPDRRALYPDVVGVDMREGPGVDLVLNLEDDLPEDIGRFAHIECCSVLEHSRQPWLLAANLERLLEKGGTLFFSVPFVWRFHGYPCDYFRFTAEGVRILFPHIDWQQLMYASDKLRPDHYLRAHQINGHPLMPRTEVHGFGTRR